MADYNDIVLSIAVLDNCPVHAIYVPGYILYTSMYQMTHTRNLVEVNGIHMSLYGLLCCWSTEISVLLCPLIFEMMQLTHIHMCV